VLRKRQRTLGGVCSYHGVGLHTGQESTVTFKPAPPGSGIVFVRSDVPSAPPIPASIRHVVMRGETVRRTTLSFGGVQVCTVEHVLAAVAGLGLDNVIVELTSDEPAPLVARMFRGPARQNCGRTAPPPRIAAFPT